MLDGGWPPVTRFGESFLRMAMSRPRVLQNGLEGSWPSKRIRTSAGSFARNKYVWPHFWPEKKHYVRGREYARRTRGTHRLDTGQRAFGQSLLPMRIIVIPLSFRCCTDVSCKCSSSSSSFFSPPFFDFWNNCLVPTAYNYRSVTSHFYGCDSSYIT